VLPHRRWWRLAQSCWSGCWPSPPLPPPSSFLRSRNRKQDTWIREEIAAGGEGQRLVGGIHRWWGIQDWTSRIHERAWRREIRREIDRSNDLSRGVDGSTSLIYFVYLISAASLWWWRDGAAGGGSHGKRTKKESHPPTAYRVVSSDPYIFFLI